jgi:hypothetical protein
MTSQTSAKPTQAMVRYCRAPPRSPERGRRSEVAWLSCIKRFCRQPCNCHVHTSIVHAAQSLVARSVVRSVKGNCRADTITCMKVCTP